MPRKRKTEVVAHSNHERWVISYADFITLLFAFFVVMFATTNADKAKVRLVSESMKEAFSQGRSSELQAAVAVVNKEDKKTGAASTLQDLVPSEKELRKVLKEEIQRGEVDIHMEARGLIISLKQGALFDSGDDTVKLSAVPTLGKIANVLVSLSNQLRLEGHTDNLPIHNDHFRNNWELSSARSIAILQLLSSHYEVPMPRMSVSGYADVAPIASNATEEGRMKNRRVDVVILSGAAARSEPVKASF